MHNNKENLGYISSNIFCHLHICLIITISLKKKRERENDNICEFIKQKFIFEVLISAV